MPAVSLTARRVSTSSESSTTRDAAPFCHSAAMRASELLVFSSMGGSLPYIGCNYVFARHKTGQRRNHGRSTYLALRQDSRCAGWLDPRRTGGSVRFTTGPGRARRAQCSYGDALGTGVCGACSLSEAGGTMDLVLIGKRALAVLLGILLGSAAPLGAQTPIVITLTGQSMIRSDLRASAPDAVAKIQPLLKGDVIFTNLEGTVAQSGQSVREGRGFLTPPESLDALRALGFNLLALSDNHAFDLQQTGIGNTLREADRRGFVHAGTGQDLKQAAAPAYLHAHGVTIGLVASASGLIAAGGRAGPAQPGVNELRIQAGDRLNEATEDLPGATGNTPNSEDAERILQS